MEAGPDYHCRKRQLGMCLGSVGSGLAQRQTHRWLESQSLFFLWLSCSAHSQAPLFLFLLYPPPPPPPLPLQMKTFPLVNRESRVEDTIVSEEYVTVVMECLGLGVNMLLKRRRKRRSGVK